MKHISKSQILEEALIPASNIYGTHSFYLDTRYYETSPNGNGSKTYIRTADASTGGNYTSTSHGVYLRNAHGQEILMKPDNITWRTLGGSIDLYFFPGPSQPEVTKSYLQGAVGLPAMQQYSTLGFHQCRWGYSNWSETEEVVMNYEKFGIPLEYIWYVCHSFWHSLQAALRCFESLIARSFP